MVKGFWRKCITFTGTALALGAVSCIGMPIAPFLTPGVFNALWKTSDQLLYIVEKAELENDIRQRCASLQSSLDQLEDVMRYVSPYYGSRIQILFNRMKSFNNRGIENIKDIEKTEFLRECFMLTLEINNDPYAAPIKSHIIEIAREFCSIEEDIRENLKLGWGKLIFGFAKSAAGLLSSLGIIESNVLRIYESSERGKSPRRPRPFGVEEDGCSGASIGSDTIGGRSYVRQYDSNILNNQYYSGLSRPR